jgi:hypothetical protein
MKDQGQEQEQKYPIVKLQGVRLSYPHLFELYKYDEKSKPEYSAQFILSKTGHAETLKQIRAMYADMVSKAKCKVLDAYEVCLRDGAKKADKKGYGPDTMFIKAKADKKFKLADITGQPVLEDNGKFYAGCYVNAIISFWLQDNSWGKRINCRLLGVQFLRDGEPLGSEDMDVSSMFVDESDML